MTSSLVCSSEDLPHWVAVTGIDDAFLYYNNPLDAVHRKRKTRISALEEFLGYHGGQSMVEVWRE